MDGRYPKLSDDEEHCRHSEQSHQNQDDFQSSPSWIHQPKIKVISIVIDSLFEDYSLGNKLIKNCHPEHQSECSLDGIFTNTRFNQATIK